MDELAAYDYTLPDELIARQPAPERTGSRLLVIHRSNGHMEHRHVSDLPELLQTGDRLVFNDTRVLAARLFGVRVQTGGQWEGLFLEQSSSGVWRLMTRTRGRLTVGERVRIQPARPSTVERHESFDLQLLEQESDGSWLAECLDSRDVLELLETFGTLPLPPYIRRPVADDDDFERYQTTFSRRPGAIAAPTAGLHFTRELIADCDRLGVGSSYVTLHVGVGTFRPISVDKLSDHKMHSEWCEITSEVVEQLREVRRGGGRIVAVGTTSVRTLESAAAMGELGPLRGTTDLFIRPPYKFRAVDVLFTNFHLPKSSLLVLVSAFAGHELTMEAYRLAVSEKYRFFSYGDAMLIL